MKFTKKEIDMKSYADMSDARLGRFTREIMAMILEPVDDEDRKKLTIASCAHILIKFALETNAREIDLEITGFTIKDNPFGDWKISVKKL